MFQYPIIILQPCDYYVGPFVCALIPILFQKVATTLSSHCPYGVHIAQYLEISNKTSLPVPGRIG